MSKVLIYSGTTEGRTLAEYLSEAKIYSDVCVATEYGEQVMPESDYINVIMGRLGIHEMQQLYGKENYVAVVDATHPYATQVTENIVKSLENTDLPYIRLLRNESGSMDNCTRYESVSQCVESLLDTEGRILVTTGSKQLSEFCRFEELRKRLVVRVLPGMESLQICYDNKLEGNQIIAMQGPFSVSMNISMIKEYGIRHLVTKDSGIIGGTPEKIEACEACGVMCHMISRPGQQTNVIGKTMDAVTYTLEQILGVHLSKRSSNTGNHGLNVVLAGIGPGNEKTMTMEVREQIAKSTHIFGARRILDGINTSARCYPYYMVEDIIPVITDIMKGNNDDSNVTILFSGDTGFYSGCEKMRQALKSTPGINLKVMPGISSVSMMAARTGISWNDAGIVSTHGVDSSIWIKRIRDSVDNNSKTFFISSGYEDINTIGSVFERDENLKFVIGYQLSYDNEEIMWLTAIQCMNISKPGLYVGIIMHES